MIKGIGQEGIRQYFNLNGNVFSSTGEIADGMNMSLNSVSNSLKSMFKYNIVEFKIVTRQVKYANCHIINKPTTLWRLTKWVLT